MMTRRNILAGSMLIGGAAMAQTVRLPILPDPGGTVLSWYENGTLRFDTAAPTPQLAEFLEVHEASRRYRRSLDRADWGGMAPAD